MSPTCECGMTIERAGANAGCPECGTTVCRSCGIELEATTYCRWCATSVAFGHAA